MVAEAVGDHHGVAHDAPGLQLLAALLSHYREAGVDVLYDDRNLRPGVMFNDMELIGVTHTIIIGERNLDEQLVEYKNRRSGEKEKLAIDLVTDFLQSKIG